MTTSIRPVTDGAPAVPPHEQWPRWLKWWLVWQFVRARFLPWLTVQEVWESLLRDAFNGVREGAARPNPHGLSTSATSADCYPRALREAEAWKGAGSPIL
jgi:hypothetical protein